MGERKRRVRRSGEAADEPPYAPGPARQRVSPTFRQRRERTVAQTRGSVAKKPVRAGAHVRTSVSTSPEFTCFSKITARAGQPTSAVSDASSQLFQPHPQFGVLLSILSIVLQVCC